MFIYSSHNIPSRLITNRSSYHATTISSSHHSDENTTITYMSWILPFQATRIFWHDRSPVLDETHIHFTPSYPCSSCPYYYRMFKTPPPPKYFLSFDLPHSSPMAIPATYLASHHRWFKVDPTNHLVLSILRWFIRWGSQKRWYPSPGFIMEQPYYLFLASDSLKCNQRRAGIWLDPPLFVDQPIPPSVFGIQELADCYLFTGMESFSNVSI